MIEEHSDGKESYKTLRLLIDWYPSSKEQIVFFELLDIYIYTYADNKSGEVEWSPMMLRGRDICDEWFDEMSDEEKQKRKAVLKDSNKKEDFIEFLYLKGSGGSWNWGRNGNTNAAFIHNGAREYFKQYF